MARRSAGSEYDQDRRRQENRAGRMKEIEATEAEIGVEGEPWNREEWHLETGRRH
jgi:hypothetical protein